MQSLRRRSDALGAHAAGGRSRRGRASPSRTRSRSRLVELEVGDRRRRSSNTRSPSASPPIAEQAHHALVALAAAGAACASMICSNTSSRPWRGWPSESNAPALISDSIVRLLSTCEVDPLAEVVEVDERARWPPARATSSADEALADVAHRRQPEGDRAACSAAAVGADARRTGGEVGHRHG